MSYLDSLSKEQKDNIAIIVNEAKKAGITNPKSIAGLLAIVSKESSFILQWSMVWPISKSYSCNA